VRANIKLQLNLENQVTEEEEEEGKGKARYEGIQVILYRHKFQSINHKT
jgi:hypothetical protein